MASAEEDLQCGLCLNTYKSPKFLPCHHTYCEGCITDLVKNTGDRRLKCPKCRQKFKLPTGGVSKLQTNFYILPLLNPERCTLHRTETFRFYCTDCKIAICRDCKLTKHDKHEAQDLGTAVNEAKEGLKDCQRRFGARKKVLEKQKGQIEEKLSFSAETCKALEGLINARVEQVSALARECGDELLTELRTTFEGVRGPLQRDERDVQDRLAALRGLQQEVTQGLEGATSQTLLALSADMRTGRGSDQQLRGLTSDLPAHSDRPVLRCDDNSLKRDVIRQCLGHVHLFQPIPLQQSVTIREMIRCCENNQLYVHAVCVESCFSYVYVAYGASGTAGEGWVVKHWQSGQLMYKSSRTIRGRVCLAGLNGGWVRVEGKEFPAKGLFSESFSSDGNESAQRKYDVYNKGDARFVLRVHESGMCDLRSVTISGCRATTDVKVCDVSAKSPIAMDVSKDGQLVAVLEEGQDHVMLYRHDNSEPHSIYRGQAEAFRPLDVCFYFIGEDERLVIADWLNDVLHVVEVGKNCKLIGHVGGECPVLVKPTALCADREGRMWIGCQGGHVLALSQQ
ncbi:uncharacterized protein [Littorina saxatilis]|uniref:Uncharacterized protein n=1 Tax=Littorina saxatilis TaxID=31220 RepID=A0AAN9BD32_9CAEN